MSQNRCIFTLYQTNNGYDIHKNRINESRHD